MANIFRQKDIKVPKQKRNSYDMSMLVNGTYKEGLIYPIHWEPVTFGDSIQMHIRAALRTAPMVWPIQTPVLVKFYNFYVRNRILQKNYQDFRFNNKPIIHPYIQQPTDSSFWRTGNIADHMGVPTTLISNDPGYRLVSGLAYPKGLAGSVPKEMRPFPRGSFPNEFPAALSSFASLDGSIGNVPAYAFLTSPLTHSLCELNNGIRISKELVRADATVKPYVCLLQDNQLQGGTGLNIVAAQQGSFTIQDGYVSFDLDSESLSRSAYPNKGLDVEHGILKWLLSLDNSSLIDDAFKSNNMNYYIMISDRAVSSPFLDTTGFTTTPENIGLFMSLDGSAEVTEVANPFGGSSPALPINALPFRAYEMIYNSHFRDTINEPFMLNGEVQYNRFISDDGDGADTTYYELKHRNWESDMYTSCRPSPQQGIAPLVGVTAAGDATFRNERGEDVTIRLRVGDDGDTVEGFDMHQINGTLDKSVARRLVDMVDQGFTINSFRNVNSYVRWVEANYRLGLRFKEQVYSNTGVSLEYKELDMPEFLGGFTIPLNVNTINQMSEGENPLGTQGANAHAFGEAKHKITHYCDEEGMIMTLMCIVPIPVYSQMLPKKFIKSSPLDYYNSQFKNIGYQPVTYEEVCPIQAYNEGKALQDTFGYQRPWHDFISNVDEAHGLFRTSMSQFLQMRTFASTPELGAEFLHIDADQLNDVFVVDSNHSDPYYGQIGFTIFKKTPIPRYYVPSLE